MSDHIPHTLPTLWCSSGEAFEKLFSGSSHYLQQHLNLFYYIKQLVPLYGNYSPIFTSVCILSFSVFCANRSLLTFYTSPIFAYISVVQWISSQLLYYFGITWGLSIFLIDYILEKCSCIIYCFDCCREILFFIQWSSFFSWLCSHGLSHGTVDFLRMKSGQWHSAIWCGILIPVKEIS